MSLLSSIANWTCSKKQRQKPALEALEKQIHEADERNKDVSFTVITAALKNVSRAPDVKTVIDSVIQRVAEDPAIRVAEDALNIARMSKRGR